MTNISPSSEKHLAQLIKTCRFHKNFTQEQNGGTTHVNIKRDILTFWDG